MSRLTIFSPCRTYRYALWREWIGGEGYAMFVGLNPSTADETQDDPTMRRTVAAMTANVELRGGPAVSSPERPA